MGNSFKQRGRSLQVTLVLAFSLFTVVMTILVTAIEVYSRYRDGVNELLRSYDRLAQAQSATLAQNIWLFNEQILKIQMESMLSDQSVSGVSLVDDQGRKRTLGEIGKSGILVRSYPIISESNRDSLGVLTIYGTDRFLRNQLRKEIPPAIVYESAKMVSAALFLLYLFYHLIGKHLTRITAYADGMGVQNLGEPLNLRRRSGRGSDELDRLSDALNHMTSRIRDDLEERRRTTEELRSMQQRLAILIDQTPLPVIEWDCNFCAAAWNHSAELLFGYTAEEALGKRADELIVPAELRDQVQVVWNQLINERVGNYSLNENRTASGAVVVCEWYNFPLIGSSGETLSIASIVVDMTAKKESEQMIQAKNRELEQIVYVASHDLRSPLVNVDGYSRELEYSLEEIRRMESAAGHESCQKVIAEMADSLHFIRTSTRQMDKLLKGLLKLSRSGRGALNITVLDMNDLISKTLAAFEYQITGMHAAAEVDQLPQCRGDETQLTQVFSNLISNALKYADPSRPLSIRISGTHQDNRSIYAVSDNGIGIRKEHQEKVFELFHRLSPSLCEGDGLGLTIVRQSLWRLDGDIRVESQEGVGSTFYVSLPHASPLSETTA